jgi:hypothetical protein
MYAQDSSSSSSSSSGEEKQNADIGPAMPPAHWKPGIRCGALCLRVLGRAGL